MRGITCCANNNTGNESMRSYLVILLWYFIYCLNKTKYFKRCLVTKILVVNKILCKEKAKENLKRFFSTIKTTQSTRIPPILNHLTLLWT